MRELTSTAALLVCLALAGCAGFKTIPDAEVAAAISGQTARFNDNNGDVEVEYYSPDGTSYLWFPGNSRIVTARWKVEGQQVCFNYELLSRNAFTGATGGRWECNPSASWINYRVAEKIPGDPFGLSNRSTTPFDLRQKSSFLALLAPPPPTLASLLERARQTGAASSTGPGTGGDRPPPPTRGTAAEPR